MTAPRSWPSIPIKRSFFLAVWAFIGRALAAQEAPPPERITLNPGQVLERALAGDAVQSFRFTLPAGSFLGLEISQRSLSLSSAVRSPAGVVVSRGEGGDGPGFQLLAVIAREPGFYELDITSRGGGGVEGRYGLKVRELRPSTEADRAREKAALALAEGRQRLYVARDPRAIDKLQEALAFWREGMDGRGEVETLGDVAGFHYLQNDKLSSLASYQSGLQRAEAVGEPEDIAWMLVRLGLMQVQLARFDEAVGSLKRALTLWERSGGPPEKAFTLECLGNAYLYKRSPAEALQVFTQALSWADQSGDLRRRARATLGLGTSKLSAGSPNESLGTFEQALALSRSAGDRESEEASELSLSALYQRKGQLQKAVDMTLKLISNGREGSHGPQYRNLGALYLELGDPDKAKDSYLMARAESRKAEDLDGEVDSLIGLSAVYRRLGDSPKALEMAQAARGVAPEESWKVFHSLGRAQLEAGQVATALGSLERALAIARASQNRLNEAATLLMLATAYGDQEKLGPATESLDQAIALGRAVEAPSIEAPGLFQRARLRARLGRRLEALKDVESARTIVETTRGNIQGRDLKASFFADQRRLYELSIRLLIDLARSQPEGSAERKGYEAQAFGVSEASRGRVLLDLLAEGRIDVRQGLSASLRHEEDRLADELSQVVFELRNRNPGPDRAQELQARIERLNRDRDQLEVEARAQNQRYADVRYPRPLDLAEVQAILPESGTALLELSLGEVRSTLFVVTRKNLAVFDLPPAVEIDRQVRRLRKALERENLLLKGEYLESASWLYQNLLSPASSLLQGFTTLWVVPDGSLYYVPFEALLTEPAAGRANKDLPYLLRDYAFAYAPSASVLASLAETRREALPGSKRLVAFAPFAGPGPGTQSRGELAPLPASRKEVSDLAALYPGEALSFFGVEADEDTVKNDPVVAEARFLHFATHAQVDERFPESSALLFAHEGSNQGLLPVHEIFNLKLSADLVVLSACQTALGKEVTGEGLIGLTRAFLYAGVPSLVVSLWNVVDGSTPDFMVTFYQGLNGSLDKAAALRKAKIDMIARGRFSHPSYWAPFILLGASR